MEFPFVSFVCAVISGHQCFHQLEDISMKRICMNKGSDTSFVRTGLGYGETSYH